MGVGQNIAVGVDVATTGVDTFLCGDRDEGVLLGPAAAAGHRGANDTLTF